MQEFEYFLDLKKLKIKKQYTYETIGLMFDTKKFLSYNLHDGIEYMDKAITEPIKAIAKSMNEKQTPVLIKIMTNDEVDTFLAHSLINKVIEGITACTQPTYRDWLVVPRPIEKNIIGTVKTIIRLVNCPPVIENLQIKIFGADGDGINFVEKIEG